MDLAAFSGAVTEAAERIQQHVHVTPAQRSSFLSDACDADVYIKLESEQVTGSFKVRGACNKVLKTLEGGDSITRTGVTLSSTGNHALACLHILSAVGVSSDIYVPATISPSKEAALRERGAKLVTCGDDCVDGENRARQAAEREGKLFISPYNDYDVMAGQGTIGAELLQQVPDVDVVFVPVGGGGLIGGVAAYLKHQKPQIKVVGCQPQASKVMYESVKAGTQVHEESSPTLSDGTSGGLEEGTLTFPVCQQCVDEWVVVSEEEIGRALYLTVKHQHKVVEGAAAMAIACVLQSGRRYAGSKVAVVSCGSNISVTTLKDILNKYDE